MLETRKTQVGFLGWEDPLEEEMETHLSTLAWEIPWIEEPDSLKFMGLLRVRVYTRPLLATVNSSAVNIRVSVSF